MDLTAELARFNPDPALAHWLSATLNQAQKDAAALKLANLKIQALTLELAHHKRIRFANKSEAFSPEQRQLFEESWDTDTRAIEAEVEQMTPERKPRVRAGRQPLPDICRASNTATSRKHAPAASAVAISSRSAKT